MSEEDRRRAEAGVQYHTHTGRGDLAAPCLIAGAPGRAEMIARDFLSGARRFANENRGLVFFTGTYKGREISVATSGMGGPSQGIVLPEAVLSGARIFIRVGSCGSLVKESEPGDVIIPTAAIRFGGTAEVWAPKEYPAFAHWQVVQALVQNAGLLAPGHFHTGVECSTDDFYTGQGRPNPLTGQIPAHMRARHEEALRLGAACYSMEAADLFVWCATEGGGLPAGAINAVFVNRHTGKWEVKGEELAARIALDALCRLCDEPGMADYAARRLPAYGG